MNVEMVLRHEIERLRAELAQQKDAALKQSDKDHEDLNRKDKRIARLRTELAECKQDAERYRWLRDTPWTPAMENIIALHRNALWDVVIDAARKGKGK